MITWNQYLAEETRTQLAASHRRSIHLQENRKLLAWFHEQPLRERVRIAHWDMCLMHYTLPETFDFCLWLPTEEVETKVFATPVPPLWHRDCNFALSPHDIPESGKTTLHEEELFLKHHRLTWSAEDNAHFDYYKGLPYSPERGRFGRGFHTYCLLFPYVNDVKFRGFQHQGFVGATYEQLTQCFGEMETTVDDRQRVAAQWSLKFADGTLAEVHSHQERPPNPRVVSVPKGIYGWWVHGKTPRALHLVADALGSKPIFDLEEAIMLRF